MKKLYRRYRLWMPWIWLPIAAWLGILFTAAGAFYVERKVKAVAASLTGARAFGTAWVPGPVAAIGEQRPFARVDVFPRAQTARSEGAEEAKVEELEEVRVRSRR